MQNHYSEAFPEIDTCPHFTSFQALRLKGKVVLGLNANHAVLLDILERVLNFCISSAVPFHPSPLPILFKRSLRVTGVFLVVSFSYESSHVTNKCGLTVIANIFAGLGIAEVVLQDSDSYKLMRTWHCQKDAKRYQICFFDLMLCIIFSDLRKSFN